MPKVILGKRTMKVSGIILETGEIVPIEMKLLAYIPRQTEKEEYVKVFQDAVLEIIDKEKRLGKLGFKVLLWFMGKTNWNNDWIYIDYKDLAEELKTTESYLKIVIPKLVKLGLIIQKAPRQKVFRLNPKYVFKGGVIARKEDIDF